MDGQFHAIEFDPSATADEVLKLVKAKIGLRDSAQGKWFVQPKNVQNAKNSSINTDQFCFNKVVVGKIGSK